MLPNMYLLNKNWVSEFEGSLLTLEIGAAKILSAHGAQMLELSATSHGGVCPVVKEMVQFLSRGLKSKS